MKIFEGYRRPNGSIGVRNHVIVINTVGELASLTKKIAQLVPGVIPVAHQAGKAQYPEDLEQTIRTLKGTAGHPNVSAALFLGMGDDDPAEKIVDVLSEEGCYVHAITFQKDKSITDVLKEGKHWLEKAVERSKGQKTETADVTELMIGLECGGSDAWSGITANPAIGSCSDAIVRDGGTSILAETTEAIGAEHILANRAVSPAVGEAFLKIVKEYEERIRETGEDIRSANPTPGNMAGGLTTLEEKSLGCIKKGGNSTLMEVVAYADKPTEKGFVFMDTPGYDVESVAGLAAGGAQIVLFSTGKGSPTGSPIVPVIKVGTNPRLYEIMSEHIDVNAGKIIEGVNTIDEIGQEIYDLIMETANGALTAAEKHKNQEFAIWRLAQTI
ncbi:putative hydrolase [Neobacillus bataviensis LMG 21833]|uniref:Putative hydrolase n=1 Tax=Neobacillus bataviensis LMG 21833 TaxID=1117379 RepID=K6DTQ6_9BACI|nr:UxaA family hydrolase [Neobacillus bataviensis]EKN71633.1 putative hydrolase [Neobacillus bataviensis LMG 21833]